VHIVCYSHLFPNKYEPVRGHFIFLRNSYLKQLMDVTVVAPLPFAPPVPFIKRWWNLFRVPAIEEVGDFQVHHPRHFKFPGSPFSQQHGCMFRAALKAISAINKNRTIDLIESPWLYPDALVAKEVGKRLGIPVVATALGSDINEYCDDPKLLPHICEVMREVDAVACVSQALAEAGAALGVDRKQFRVIYNGVDGTQFRPQDKLMLRKKLGLPADRQLLLFVGHHEFIKGMDTLRKAWPKLKKVNGHKPLLVMIGSGPMRRELIEELEPLGVVFITEQPHKLIQNWIAAADALLLPSYAEGVPNVLLEANACGVPIICTDVGGVSEIMDDVDESGKAHNGIMVAAKDPQALADGMARVLSLTFDPLRIRENALRFNWEACAEGFKALFEELLSRRVK